MSAINKPSCLIYITDIHCDDKKPRRRLSPPMPEIMRKLQHIGQRAEELGALAIICGGDVGDRHNWTLGLLADMEEAFDFGVIPVYGIVGNHDLPAHNYQQINKRIGIWHLDKKDVIQLMWAPKEIGNFVFWPFHSGTQETIDFVAGSWTPPSDYPGKRKKNVLHIAIIHAPVGPFEAPGMIDHKSLMLPSFFYAAGFGDIHPGFLPYELLTGVTVFNPGSIYRRTIKEVDRIPKFAILWSDGRIEYEEIPVPPKELVFDLDGIGDEEDEIFEERIGFAAAVNAAKLKRDQLDTREFVRVVGASGNFPLRSIQLLEEELPKR